MRGYEYMYRLRAVREVEPGWYKLGWRPIKHNYSRGAGTWNLYRSRLFRDHHHFGFMLWRGGAHNGWGRSYERFDIRIALWWTEINFWIIWNIIVMEEGPSDVDTRTPIDVSHLKGKHEKK